jgi:hypothetical protein
MALGITREKAGLAATYAPTEPWGVIMDWVVSQAIATIIAFSNGHASIYLSTGGGFIGGGESHESVRNAAKRMVAVAGECQPHTHATSEYPLPQKQGEVLFYLLTDAGIFTATASKEDLSSHHHPLSKLHDAAQGIITEYRSELSPTYRNPYVEASILLVRVPHGQCLKSI